MLPSITSLNSNMINQTWNLNFVSISGANHGLVKLKKCLFESPWFTMQHISTVQLAAHGPHMTCGPCFCVKTSRFYSGVSKWNLVDVKFDFNITKLWQWVPWQWVLHHLGSYCSPLAARVSWRGPWLYEKKHWVAQSVKKDWQHCFIWTGIL